MVWQIPDAIVVCAPDYGWRYHPKHVEQFPDKINGLTLHLVGYILNCDLFMFKIQGSIRREKHSYCGDSCPADSATAYRRRHVRSRAGNNIVHELWTQCKIIVCTSTWRSLARLYTQVPVSAYVSQCPCFTFLIEVTCAKYCWNL